MYDQNDGGDGFDRPYDPPAPDTRLYDSVAAMYQSLLGRAGSAGEINEWIRATGGNAAQIQQGIWGSPEGQAYATRNANKPGGAATTDPTAGPTSGPVGGGGTKTAPAPAPSGPSGPTFTPPSYTAPGAFAPPPAFSYADFQAPSTSDLMDDPGYQFRLKEGSNALERSAAARGTLNTGGTLKDVINYGSDLASTEYGNLWNRDMSAYQTNRSNAFDNYKTNYGISKDTYDTNYTTQYKDPFAMQYQGAQDSYNSQVHNSDLDRMYSWNKYIQDYNATRNAKLDDFDMKYKVLNLR